MVSLSRYSGIIRNKSKALLVYIVPLMVPGSYLMVLGSIPNGAGMIVLLSSVLLS